MDCIFCSSAIEPGTGKMYVKRNGDVLNFCSSKCQRNQLDLKRVNRYTKWTGKARELKSERQ